MTDVYDIRPHRDAFSERKPPWSEDAEVAVLCAMLNEVGALLAAVEIVHEDSFYAEKHRRLFRAMVGIAERGGAVDPVTLSEELTKRGELDAVGGKEYIGWLVDAVPTAANIAYHSEIVAEKALTRRLIEVGTSIVQRGFEGRDSAKELLDAAESAVFNVGHQARGNAFTRIKDLLWPTMERIEALQQGGRTVTGVPTGFTDLDELTSGFQNADLIIIAARPSMGKTALALNMAQHAAIEKQLPVAVFSLEMSKDSLVQRMITSEARIDAQRIRKGLLRDDDFPRLARAAGVLGQAPIWIDDTPALSLLEMRSKARRLRSESDIGMVIIDYLQLMQGPRSNSGFENRNQEVSAISRGLKALAKELGVPVIALSQLSRGPEQRPDKRPQLSDLRDSGAIEQDADVILFLYRQEFYDGPTDKNGNSLEGKVEVIIGKQRNGPIGTVNLFFHKRYTRFENLTNPTQGPVAQNQTRLL